MLNNLITPPSRGFQLKSQLKSDIEMIICPTVMLALKHKLFVCKGSPRPSYNTSIEILYNSFYFTMLYSRCLELGVINHKIVTLGSIPSISNS